MSDVMLFGVLRMPYELAMSSDLSRLQFWQRAQQAADEIERLRAAIAAPPWPLLRLDFVKSESRFSGKEVRTTYRLLSDKAGPLTLYAAPDAQKGAQS